MEAVLKYVPTQRERWQACKLVWHLMTQYLPNGINGWHLKMEPTVSDNDCRLTATLQNVDGAYDFVRYYLTCSWESSSQFSVHYTPPDHTVGQKRRVSYYNSPPPINIGLERAPRAQAVDLLKRMIEPTRELQLQLLDRVVANENKYENWSKAVCVLRLAGFDESALKRLDYDNQSSSMSSSRTFRGYKDRYKADRVVLEARIDAQEAEFGYEVKLRWVPPEMLQDIVRLLDWYEQQFLERKAQEYGF